MLKKLIVKSCFIVFILFVTGCTSSDRPSDSDIKKIYFDSIYSGEDGDFSKKTLKIIGYQKVNGYFQNERTYIAEINTKVEFIVGLNEMHDLSIKYGEKPRRARLMTRFLKAQYGNFSSGKIIERKLNVSFIYTEKGWKVHDVSERGN